MIIIYDNLYGTTYRNIADVLFRSVTVFGVQKYRFEFWFDGDKKKTSSGSTRVRHAGIAISSSVKNNTTTGK